MINKILIGYISQNLNRRVNPIYIQNTLIKQGYTPRDVYDTINYVKANRLRNIQRPLYTQPPIAESPANMPNETNKKLWLYIGIFALTIIIVLIFIFANSSSKKISEDKLAQGTYLNLKQDKEINFNVNGEEHKLIANLVRIESVDMTLESEPIRFTIKTGETKKFDLNKDKIYDVSIKLESIEDSIPHFFIKKIGEKICTKNWNCSDWSVCTRGNQTRKCTDLNRCNTTQDKPKEKQACSVLVEVPAQKNESIILTCAEKNGTICNQTTICTTTMINASDSLRCCKGNCRINQSSENQDECSTAQDCNDENYSTKDACTGIPKICLHNLITECINGDNYCPTNCNYSIDSDCELVETDNIRTECGTNIWCYHDKVIETNNYTLCYNINKYWNDVDQGVVGDCIYYIAINLNNCSLCEYIVKQDTHDLCTRDVC